MTNPTKTGHTFTGWSGTDLTGDDNLEVTIPQGSTGAREYTAHWSINSYRLDLIAGPCVATVAGANTYEYGANVEATCTFELGYEFASWSGDLTTGIFAMPAQNATMTANAKPISYTIFCDLNGGNTPSENPLCYDITSATITLTTPIKDGYEFIGWEGSNIPEGTASKTVTIPNGSTGARNYVASYTPVYNIVYILDNGVLETANPATYTVFSDSIVLNKPTKAGTYFMGWTCEDYFGASMTVTIPQGSTGNKTYTAVWGETLTFTLPGGVPLVMNKCPAGIFLMGSSENEIGRNADGRESPQHYVTLTKNFYIGKFEVTQAQFESIMGFNPSVFTGDDSRPVENASPPTYIAFCASLTDYLESSIPSGYTGFSLPTEAQWEYACRAGTLTTLNNDTNLTITAGTDLNLEPIAWYDANSGNELHPVGQKQPNAWELYDMHGNIQELCSDLMNIGYFSVCGDCSDPMGPTESSYDPPHYVTKGGNWYGNAKYCRSSGRGSLKITYYGKYYGIRVILSPAP